MKSVFKAIILLMVVFVIFTGCTTPQESKSSGSKDSKQQSATTQVPIGIDGINFSMEVGLSGTNNNYSTFGTYRNYFYTFWCDNRNPSGSVKMILDDNDGYTTTVTNLTGGFVCGIGWNPGSTSRVVNFTGSYDSNHGGAWGLYGWTINPLVEYYVAEHNGDVDRIFDSQDIDGQVHKQVGFMGSDGIAYGVSTNYRVNKPSIIGSASFWQYMSHTGGVYERDSGTITFKNHVDYWETCWKDPDNTSLGKMTLGDIQGKDNQGKFITYQILFTEMWSKQSNGEPVIGQYVNGSSYGKIISSSGAPAEYYYLNNNWSKKEMTVTDNTGYADVVCQTYNPNWTSQQWRMEEITGGPPSPGATVRIKNIWSGKYLTVADTSDYADVKAQDLNTSWTSQQWVIDSASLSIAKLKNVWSGKYLTVTDSGESADIRCQPLNTGWTSQKWVLEIK